MKSSKLCQLSTNSWLLKSTFDESAIAHKSFGEAEVKQLAEHFKTPLSTAGADTADIVLEWSLAKRTVLLMIFCQPDSISIEVQRIDLAEMWESLWRTKAEQQPNILQLVNLVLSLQAHSAECEQGFSLHKTIHTDLRTKLKPHTVTDLMRVRIYSSDVTHFYPEPAFQLWQTSGLRRRSRPHKSRNHADRYVSVGCAE